MTTFQYNAPPTIAAFMRSQKFGRFISGPVGCLSATTEFLTPSGWKRMDAYAPGDLVAVWRDGVVSFEAAMHVRLPATEPFIRFDSGSLVMELSPEHRIVYTDYRGAQQVTTAQEAAAKPSRRTIPTTFALNRPDTGMRDEEIRFRVAFSADGYIPKAGFQQRVTVRKERKKARLRELLTGMGLEWAERGYKNRPTETSFFFRWPGADKSLDFIWDLSSRQLAVVIDECTRWDGLNEHAEKRFYTSMPEHADAIQFAAHASGYRAAIKETFDKRNADWAPMYTVAIRSSDNHKNRAMIRAETRITRAPAEDGFKYCFRTSTGYFVARCEDTVFVTGNSGKTTGVIMEILRRSAEQAPAPDGLRKTRWAIVRNTMQQLRTTILADVQNILQPIVKFYTTESTIQIRAGDIHADLLLMPLDTPDDQRRLLSTQLTGAWLSEFREIDFKLLPALAGRLGRFPSTINGGVDPTWFGMVGETNSFNEGSDWHKFLVLERPPEYEFFRQPSGLSPQAENVENLPANYYQRLAEGQSEDWCRVYIENDFGLDLSGQAVFRASFSAERHLAAGLQVNPFRPIMVAMDFGRTPTAILMQLTPDGRLNVLEERCSTDMGLEQFVKQELQPLLYTSTYSGREVYIVGDPAGTAKSQINEMSCFDVLKAAGFRAYPASTNDPGHRIRAVESLLLQSRGAQPAVAIEESKCPNLVRALRHDYRYKRSRTGQLSNLPDKNGASHVADAFQYGCLAVTTDLPGRIMARRNFTPRPNIPTGAWT